MNKSNRMAALAAQLAVESKPDSQPNGKPERHKARKPAFRTRSAPQSSGVHAALQTELEKMTIKLRRPIRERLLDESYKRKKAKSGNWQIQEIVSEAVNAYLGEK